MAIRPKTLVAGWAPVLVGGAIVGPLWWIGADQLARWDRIWTGFVAPWIGTFVVALAIQIATNLINDAADFKKGADTEQRLGPPRAVAMGLLPSRAATRGGLACLAVAGAVGLWLASISSWWLLVPGTVALLAAIAYTAGPRPLAYMGLGEIFVLIFFGVFAVGGTVVVLMTSMSWASPSLADVSEIFLWTLWFSLPMGLLAVSILEVNNIRDAPTDREVGKATLAVRVGDRWARRLFLACIVGAFLIPAIPMASVVIYWGETGGLAVVAYAAVCLWLAVGPVRAVRAGTSGRQLNPVLGQVARLEAVVAIGFALLMLLATTLLSFGLDWVFS